MKKIYSFIFGCAAITLAASCTQELSFTQVEKPGEEANLVNITVIASEKPEVVATTETKTFIDGTSVKWSNSDEKLKVFEVATPAEGDAVTTQATTSEGVTSDSGVTMSFGVSMADKSSGSYDSFDYYAIYPSSAYQTGSAVTGIALNTHGAQTPTATNFDASADLLIAKKIENGAAQASTLVMQFARVVAIGKMTIKNLESADPITKITFSAKVGGEAVALAGRTNFNLETAKPVSAYASNTQDYAIILDYEGQNITANTNAGMVAYFTCYPFAINAETPGSFKVVVETATQSFTKEVSVSSAKGLAFNIGKASVFSVDMDGIAGVDKAVDLRYAYLDGDDYVNAGGSNSYSNITVSKTHGDAWETHALYQAGIQINSGYYIKLPDFAEVIKTVIVTLPVAASGKTLSLNTLANGSGTEIASLTTDSELSYEFDLSSVSYKTAYLLSDGTIKFSKIEVYAGTDNRTALDAPQNVAAVLNTSDPEVTNSINVSWDAVDGAGSYLITLMDENTDITTKVADASPFTVTGLAYDMEYEIGVKAIPADAYLNTESAETSVPSPVTTGSEPVGAKYELVSTVNEVTEGDYIITWDNSYYLPSGSTSGTNPAVGTGISVADGKITNAVSSDMVWTFTGDNNSGFTISDGTNILHSTNSAQGISINTTSTRKWTVSIDGTYGMLLHGDDGGTRNLAVYNNTTWRYYATGVSYTGKLRLYKLADPRTDVTLEFAEDAFDLTVDSSEYDSFTPQTATATPSVSPITYAISGDTGIASGFNTSTGAFTLTGTLGTATITASFAGDSDYKPAEASYTVTVKAASINTSTEANPYSVDDVLSLIGTLDSSTEVEDVYVKGIVSEIVTAYNSTYGNVTFNISADGSTEGDQFQAYRATASSADDFQVGDAVLMVGTAKNYNGNTPEYIAGARAVTVIHKPSFTPNGGTFTEDSKSVTISAATGTTIYYTIDGTDPTTSSSVYSSALTLTATTTVKAIAVKDGLTTGIASATFTKSAGGGTKEYTLTITADNFNTTSYAANNNEKRTNAVASDNSTFEVAWTSNQVMKSGSNMQWQKNKGYIYNSTDLGTIKSVTVNSSAGSFTTYYGESAQPSSGNAGTDKGFFKTSVGDATGTTSSIVIVFEK